MIVEYKRATDAGVISQGLFYLSWLMVHKAEFGHLARDVRARSRPRCCGAHPG